MFLLKYYKANVIKGTQNLNNIFFIYKLESTDKERQSRGPNGVMTETPRGPKWRRKRENRVEKKSQRKKRAPPSSLPMEAEGTMAPYTSALPSLK